MIDGIVFSTNKIIIFIYKQIRILISKAQFGIRTLHVYFHELLLSSFMIPSHKNFNYNPTKSILTIGS